MKRTFCTPVTVLTPHTVAKAPQTTRPVAIPKAFAAIRPEFPPSSVCSSGLAGTFAARGREGAGVGAVETSVRFILVRLGGAVDASRPVACLLRIITRGTARPTQKPAVYQSSMSLGMTIEGKIEAYCHNWNPSGYSGSGFCVCGLSWRGFRWGGGRRK